MTASWRRCCAELFPLRPTNIRRTLKLNRPIYRRTAAYGHFGRAPEKDGGFSWEKTDLADQIRKAVEVSSRDFGLSFANGRIMDAAVMHSDTPQRSRAPGAFFGRRKGKALRAGQARLFETLLPSLCIDLQSSAPASLATLFPNAVREVRLEIGFGGAEHLIAQAEANPACGFIGVEPFLNGMAKALAAIDAQGLAQYPAASRRRDRTARLAAGSFARPGRSALSGSVAEAAALEAPLRAGPQRRRDRARAEAGRRISASRPTSRIMPPGRWCGCCARSDFEWTAETADDWRKPWPDFSARATKPRPCAKAARPVI